MILLLHQGLAISEEQAGMQDISLSPAVSKQSPNQLSVILKI